MTTNLKALILQSRKPSSFLLATTSHKFQPGAIIVKVLAFSLDPVMRVWLSGAKTNFRVVKEGDVFNCFGVGVVISKGDETYPEGTYLFGNTGTVNFFELTHEKQKQCFPVPAELVAMYGPFNFIYLINNGLAAYQGFEILSVQPDQNVLISTASGATGLLLCHLIKKKGAKVVALCSAGKEQYVQEFSEKVINYRDWDGTKNALKELQYQKYFDNVGQKMLDLVLDTIGNHGTIALCGAIANYLDPKEGGLRNFQKIITKRLKLQGINFSHLVPQAQQIFEEYRNLKLKISIEKMQNFQKIFNELFTSGGSIIGKVVFDPHL